MKVVNRKEGVRQNSTGECQGIKLLLCSKGTSWKHHISCSSDASWRIFAADAAF